MCIKKILSAILASGIILSIGTTVIGYSEEKVTVTLDQKEVYFPDAQPFIDARNRTLVPIRFISEEMGAIVEWEAETRSVKITKDKDIVKYNIGDMKGYLNDEIHVFDTYGIIKEDRTFVPLRFVSEMLSCDVKWSDETRIVTISSPAAAVKFPEPVVTVHYPESESDKRLFWVTLDNYNEFKRDCPNYEFKIEFETPEEFNTFEQDEGAVNGWQKYNRNEFVKLTSSGNTIVSVGRAFYTTREKTKHFTVTEGDALKFRLTVRRICSNESKEYSFNESIKMPYSLIETEE